MGVWPPKPEPNTERQLTEHHRPNSPNNHPNLKRGGLMKDTPTKRIRDQRQNDVMHQKPGKHHPKTPCVQTYPKHHMNQPRLQAAKALIWGTYNMQQYEEPSASSMCTHARALSNSNNLIPAHPSAATSQRTHIQAHLYIPQTRTP